MPGFVKRTEFWTMLAMPFLTFVWPDAPQEVYLTLITYVGSRGVAKLGSQIKKGIQSSEFYVAIGSVVVKFLFPGLPEEALWGAIAYVGGRGVAKAKK